MERASTSAGDETRARASAGEPGDPGRHDARLAEPLAILAGGDVRVLSLDVFDTVLFRRVSEPVDAFDVLGARLRDRGVLAPGVEPALFRRLRIAAEGRAREQERARGGGLEVTLEAIWERLPARLFAGGARPADGPALEGAVERDLLVPDLDVAALIEAAREAGTLVVAVSDTYFSERELRLLLARGPLAATRFDRIFPSSRFGAGKASGLFSIVLEELRCAPEQMLHVGDNHFADVVAPARLGIRTAYFERRPPELARIMERERIHGAGVHPVHGDHGLAALRAKVLHRAEATRQPEGARAFWAYGAGSLGAPLAGFAEWVHERAAAAGCSRVFCLMREGELLVGLVNAAAPAAATAVHAEPIWLSREVCARAGIREGTREELEALFVRRRLPTLREYAGTLGLALDDLPELAPEADRRLDDAGFGEVVIDAIVHDPALRARVVAGSQALRRRIVRYVEQRLPAGERRLALVDLGWGATIQASVQRLLDEAGLDVATLGLYLVTREGIAGRLLDGLDAQGFLGQAGLPAQPVDALMRSPEILEQICMPDHGSQVDLTEDLRPVLADAPGPSLQSVERAAVQQGILAFQREWVRYRTALPASVPALHDGARPALLAVVVRAMVAPTSDEAALFSGWLHDENFGSAAVESIAEGRAARALAHMDPRTLVDVPMTELYWPFGLAALHDEHLAASVSAAAAGVLDWDAFSSALETGPVELYSDVGWGWEEGRKIGLRVRRNRRGLSFAKATVRGDYVKRVRLDPVQEPAVVRLDFVSLRCQLAGGGEASIDLQPPKDLRGLKVRGGRAIAPGDFELTGPDPHFVVDLERRLGVRVWEVEVECAFAVLPLARFQAREPRARLRAAGRTVAKEWRIGAPLRLAKRLLSRG